MQETAIFFLGSCPEAIYTISHYNLAARYLRDLTVFPRDEIAHSKRGLQESTPLLSWLREEV